MKALTHRHTLAASYIGYITQAIVNNLAPLLFTVFQAQFGLSLAQLTGLITLNFGVQLLVDAVSALFIDKIGYRTAAVAAHVLSVLGLVGMGALPALLPSAYAGLVVAIVVNAIGGGLIEVIISPIVEALPGEKKAASMSLLHSFYCWGFVLVVLLSTLFFATAGTGHWMWLCMLWALVPLCNILLFARCPIEPLLEEGVKALPLRKLFTKKVFLFLMLGMACAAASEQAISQWASLFAESGLGVSKTMGDLLGPCAFAVLMGTARLVLGTGKINLKLETILLGSGALCIASYLLAVFAPTPLLSLVGCAICGFSVGSMWPGLFSLAAKAIPAGGTAMYALIALAGDVGCAGGPGLVGFLSNLAESGRLALFGTTADGALRTGLLFAILFPLGLVCSVLVVRGRHKNR